MNIKKILSVGSSLALILGLVISFSNVPIVKADTVYNTPPEASPYTINSSATGVNVLEAFIKTPGVTFADPGFTNLDSGWNATTINPTYAAEYGTLSSNTAENLNIANSSSSVVVNFYVFTGCTTQPASACPSTDLTDAYQITYSNGAYQGFTANLSAATLASENTATPANLTLTVPASATITQSTLVPETNGVPTSNAAVTTAIAHITPIAVTLANTGGTASANVRISPIGAGSNIQLWAQDSNSNWYDINVTGWGPAGGFSVPANSGSITTKVYPISSVAGSYTLTANLVDAATPSTLVTSGTGKLVVNVAPAAVFSITPPATQAYTGTPTSFGVGISGATLPSDTSDQITLAFNVMDGSTPVVGQTFTLSGIAGQNISGLGTLATSTDASGNISVTGSLNDLASMFNVTASQLEGELSGTSAAATVSTTFANPGTYTLSLTASDANGTIASTTGTVTVVSPVAISGITLNGTNLPASVTTTGSGANWTVTVPQDTATTISSANYTMTSATLDMSGADTTKTYPVTFVSGQYVTDGESYGTLAYTSGAWTLTPSNSQTFETAGTWVLTATVQDDAGTATPITLNLTVAPTSPVAISGIALNMSGTNPPAGSAISATGSGANWTVTVPQDTATTISSANYTMTSATLDMSGADTTKTYPVTFVSGQYVTDGESYGTLAYTSGAWTLTPSNSQTFETAGTWVLTATVQDDAGTATPITLNLTVAPTSPVAISGIALNMSGTNPPAGSAISATGSGANWTVTVPQDTATTISSANYTMTSATLDMSGADTTKTYPVTFVSGQYVTDGESYGTLAYTSGAWTLTPSNSQTFETAGTWVLTATVQDDAGTATPITLNLTVAPTSPVAISGIALNMSGTNPPAGSAISATGSGANWTVTVPQDTATTISSANYTMTSATLDMSGADTTKTYPVTFVSGQYVTDGESYGTLAYTSGAWTLTPSNSQTFETAGTWVLTATVQDDAGTATPITLNLTVAPTSPVAISGIALNMSGTNPPAGSAISATGSGANWTVTVPQDTATTISSANYTMTSATLDMSGADTTKTYPVTFVSGQYVTDGESYGTLAYTSGAWTLTPSNSQTFETAGTWVLTATVQDDAGTATPITLNLTVAPTSPVAISGIALNMSGTNPPAGSAISATGSGANWTVTVPQDTATTISSANYTMTSATLDMSGADTTKTYPVTFVSGQYVTDGESYGTLAYTSGAWTLTPSNSQTFETAGTWVLTATVQDDAGTATPITLNLTVAPTSPVAISGIALNMSGTNPPAGSAISATGSGANWTVTVPQDTATTISSANYTMTSATLDMSGADTTKTYPVTFVSGQYVTDGESYGTLAYTSGAWTLTPSNSQTFETAGTWVLTATVQDDAGTATPITLNLTVAPTSPVAISGIALNMSGTNPPAGSAISATGSGANWTVTVPQDTATTISSANYTMTSATLDMSGADTTKTYPVTFVSGQYVTDGESYGTLAYTSGAWTLTPSNSQTFETAGTWVLTATVQDDAGTATPITLNLTVAPVTYALDYTAGANGTITGTSTQTVDSGSNGSAVTATPNSGYQFSSWSDGSTANPRTDSDVTADVSVTANFTAIPVVTSGGGGGGGGGAAQANLSITSAVDNGAPATGSTINYTLTVNAAGPSASYGIVTTDVLPAGLTFVSASTSEGSYNNSTGAWTIGSLNVGQTATLTITATVTASTGTAITNTATVSESAGVLNADNDSSSVTVNVGGTSTGQVLGASTTGGGNVGQVLGASTTNTVALLQELQNLEQQLITLEFKANSCSLTFNANLSKGMTSSDVQNLQKVLNYSSLTQVAATGAGSPNNETTYFGSATQNAVIAFQNIFANQILTPNGLTSGNGYVGASTRSVLNGLCSQ